MIVATDALRTAFYDSRGKNRLSDSPRRHPWPHTLVGRREKVDLTFFCSWLCSPLATNPHSSLKLIFLLLTPLFVYSVSLPFNKYLSCCRLWARCYSGLWARTVRRSDNALHPRSQHSSGGERTTYHAGFFQLELFLNSEPWKKSTFHGLIKYAEPDSCCCLLEITVQQILAP